MITRPSSLRRRRVMARDRCVPALAARPQGWIVLTSLRSSPRLPPRASYRRRHSNPRDHALGERAALLAFVVLHAGIGILFLISNFLRIGAGFISRRRLTDLRLTRLWIDYTVVTAAIALGLVLALPYLAAMLEGRS